MARILLASNNDDIRGKLGQIIYTKSKSSHTQRKEFRPTDLANASQLINRNALKAITEFWRTLVNADRQTWLDAAKTKIFSNAFGIKYNPSAFNIFVKCNRLHYFCSDGALCAVYSDSTFSSIPVINGYTFNPGMLPGQMNVDFASSLSLGPKIIIYVSKAFNNLNNPSQIKLVRLPYYSNIPLNGRLSIINEYSNLF